MTDRFVMMGSRHFTISSKPRLLGQDPSRVTWYAYTGEPGSAGFAARPKRQSLRSALANEAIDN